MKKLFILLTMAIGFVAAGCSNKSEDPERKAGIAFAAGTGTERELDAEGDSFNVAFTASAQWRVSFVSTYGSWCRVSPSSGEAGTYIVEVIAEANNAPLPRDGKLEFTCGSASVAIVLTQAGNDGSTHPDRESHNKIYYKTDDSQLLVPYQYFGGEKEEWPFGEGVELTGNVYTEQEGGIMTFSGDVTRIGNGVFTMSQITDITLPDRVDVIGDIAFFGCASLQSIIIPEGVTTLGDRAFGECSSLRTVTVPGSLVHYGSEQMQIFSHCSALESFYGPFSSSDHRCLIIDGRLEAFAPAGLIRYTVPAGVSVISGGGGFRDCTHLEELTIPASVSEVEDFALGGLHNLTRFYSPYAGEDGRSLIIGGKMVGFAPYGLTEYEIPEGVKELNRSVFEECTTLETVVVPASVEKLGDCTFRNCSSLYNITFNPTVPPVIEAESGMYPFDGISSWAKIHVPSGSVDAYKSADVWSSYASIITSEDDRDTSEHITVTLLPNRTDLTATRYFGAAVEWVQKNIDTPLGATSDKDGRFFVTSYGDEEFYSGCSTYFNNVNNIAASARSQYGGDSYQSAQLRGLGLAFTGDGYSNLDDGQVQSLMLIRLQYVMSNVLKELNPAASAGDTYTLKLYVYRGTVNDGTATNTDLIYRVEEDGTFKFTDMIRHGW